MKSGNLNFLEPSGPLKACNGNALPLYMNRHLLRREGKECNYIDNDIRNHEAYKAYRSKDLKLFAFSVSEMVRSLHTPLASSHLRYFLTPFFKVVAGYKCSTVNMTMQFWKYPFRFLAGIDYIY